MQSRPPVAARHSRPFKPVQPVHSFLHPLVPPQLGKYGSSPVQPSRRVARRRRLRPAEMTTGNLEPLQKTKSAASAAHSISVAGHEIGYPHGHLGHLSDAEEEALRGFKV